MDRFLLVSESGHVEPMADYSKVDAGMATLLSLCAPRIDAKGRSVWNTHSTSMTMLERHFDSAVQSALREAQSVRGDSGFSAGMGMFNPRDLTYRFRQVMEERTPPLSAKRIFQVNTEVPPGALDYEQTRVYTTGEAVVYRGGSGADIPEIGIGQAWTKAPVVYLVSKASINWLEQLRVNMTGLDTQARKMRGARLVIEELENRWAFNGAPEHGVFGLLNHPYVDTGLSDVAWIDGTDPDDIAADFAYWANYTRNVSRSAFQVDTWIIGNKLESFLRNKKYSTDASKSLMDWMLQANPHIKTVEVVPEMDDAGGEGIHAMAFVRRGESPADRSVELVKPMMPTVLPPEAGSLATQLFMVSGYGGLNHREVGDNLVVYVEGPQ